MRDNSLTYFKTLVFAAALLAFAAAPASAVAIGGSWTEIGDAFAGETLDSLPQATVGGGPLGQIHGSLGDSFACGEESICTDNIDIFTIQIGDIAQPCDECALISVEFPAFIATVGWDGQPQPTLVEGPLPQLPPLFLALFDEFGGLMGGNYGNLTVEGVLSGIYHVGIFTDITFDPPYTVNFDPLSNVQFSTALPEPATLGVLGAGLAGFAAFRRRNARK